MSKLQEVKDNFEKDLVQKLESGEILDLEKLKSREQTITSDEIVVFIEDKIVAERIVSKKPSFFGRNIIDAFFLAAPTGYLLNLKLERC